MHMQMDRYRAVDQQEWAKVLFYTDLVVMAIFVVSLVLLVVNSYFAGYELQFTRYAASHDMMWNVAIATAFLTGSMAWIFFRFFKNQYLAMKKTPYS